MVGYLSSMWGSRKDPSMGGCDFHPGLDISANAGTPIHATADGAVESAGYAGNYGNAVVLKHGFGLFDAQAHVANRGTREMKIKRGAIIGYVGATGRATQSAL